MKALTVRQDGALTTTGVMTAFGAFLRLYVADGDASPEMIRSDYGNAAQFVEATPALKDSGLSWPPPTGGRTAMASPATSTSSTPLRIL